MSEEEGAAEDAVHQQKNTPTDPTSAWVAALSPEELRQALSDLHKRHLALEAQNKELRQAQAALEASQARYVSLYEQAPVGYATLNEQGIILEANHTFAALLGVAKENLAARPFAQFIHPAHHNIFHGQLQQIFADGTPRNSELQLKRAADDFFWVQLEATAAQETDGTPVCRITISDVTARKRAEQAAQRSENRFRALIENAPDAINLINAEGRLTYASPSALRLLGYTLEEALGANMADYVHPEDLTAVFPLLVDLVQHPGKVVTTRYRFRHRNGSWRWLESTISNLLTEPGVESILFNFRDITERSQAEEALRESEEKLRLLFEILPVGVSILNNDRKLVYMNPALASILEISEEDLRQGDYRQRKYVGASGEPMRGRDFASNRAIEEQQTVWHVETGVVKNNGRIIWTDVSAVPVSFSDWKVVVVTTNITERKQGEEALRESHRHLEKALEDLRQAQAQLVQQERLAAVGQLAAGIAHDFNNILAVITLYVEMSLRTPDLPADLSKRLKTIGHQARRAAHLVQQILDFGRRAVLQSHSLDLGAFLEEQVELWQRTIPESIRIRFRNEANGRQINADPTRIQQMLTNLVLNARDAMPHGGKLTLKLEPLRLDSPQTDTPPGLDAGDWLRITVRDTGAGISPAALPHIFEPFFTTKEPGQGSGLGLAQVYGIVKQHKGHIKVQTEESKGTTFTIYLPALEKTAVEATAVPATGLRHGHGETILIVEDNDTLRGALAHTLTLLNYQALTAANGREALGILDKQTKTASGAAKKPDVALVLSDLVMPDMGGKELLLALQQRQLALPVVIVSGHPLDTALQTNQGFAGWLPKPIDIQELATLLAQALQR